MLSVMASQLADEVRNHDWSDAPYRFDRAGHQRDFDSPGKRSAQVLDERETTILVANVAAVLAQVLRHNDPNLPLQEFFEACGVSHRLTRTSSGRESGALKAALRWTEPDVPAKPGGYEAS